MSKMIECPYCGASGSPEWFETHEHPDTFGCTEKDQKPRSFRVEVIADNTGKWCGNGLSFDTVEAAQTYASDLWSRWTAVRQTRVVDAETGEPVEK